MFMSSSSLCMAFLLYNHSHHLTLNLHAPAVLHSWHCDRWQVSKVMPRKPLETKPCFKISSTFFFTVSTWKTTHTQIDWETSDRHYNIVKCYLYIYMCDVESRYSTVYAALLWKSQETLVRFVDSQTLTGIANPTPADVPLAVRIASAQSRKNESEANGKCQMKIVALEICLSELRQKLCSHQWPFQQRLEEDHQNYLVT